MILSLLSTLIGIAATLNLLRWKKRKASKRPINTSISIIKPIRGLENSLFENLESFFKLKTAIPFELILCVKNPEDPCLKFINDLVEKYPNIDYRISTSTPDLGRNPKISNMHMAWREAKYDLLLISDSNVHVEPDYLESLLAERRRGASLVTQAVYGAGATCLGGHLDVIHLNTFYLKATAFVDLFGFNIPLGKAMLLSRSDFDRVGGLFSIRNYLAEDFMMGELMEDAGYEVKVAPLLLQQTSVMTSFSAYWNRHVRWARLRKSHVFLTYFFEPVMFESLWPILLMIFSHSSFGFFLGLQCLSLQVTGNILLHSSKFKNSDSFRSLKFFLLKDFLAPIIWFAGLVSNSVNWRGQKLQLRFGGKLGSKYFRPARLRRRLRYLRSLAQS